MYKELETIATISPVHMAQLEDVSMARKLSPEEIRKAKDAIQILFDAAVPSTSSSPPESSASPPGSSTSPPGSSASPSTLHDAKSSKSKNGRITLPLRIAATCGVLHVL